MILVETSVWVDFDRGRNTLETDRLKTLISNDQVVVTEPVVMEVLAGVSDPGRRERMSNALRSFHWLPFDSASDFDAASRIYSGCRSKGVTPRGLVDCLIAAVAMRTSIEVLSSDRDFAAIASIFPLRLLAP